MASRISALQNWNNCLYYSCHTEALEVHSSLSLSLSNSLTYHTLSSLISSTISGFNKVEVSPKLLKSPSAIFLRIRRIIFPDLVFGNPDTNWILSNFAIGPICSEINWLISFARFSRFLSAPASFRITKP